MSLRNTPSVKNSKSLDSPCRAMRLPNSSQKPPFVKQLSAHELRDRLKLHSDDVLNTAFAATPPLSRDAIRSSIKSKSTNALNACLPPSSTSSSSAQKSVLSTPRAINKRLFASANESTFRTPDRPTKLSFDTPTPRSIRSSSETPRGIGDDENEISNLTVAIRVRPMNARECSTPSAMNIITVEGKKLTVLAGKNVDNSAGLSHTFTYDQVFWSCNPKHENYANQETVFQETGVPLIDRAFEGYNACLFAYGQTGSGKSYSMMGIDSDDDLIRPNPEAGIIPRFCHELFNRIKSLKGKISAEVEVSYYEIYNEQIYDLLSVTPTQQVGGQTSTPRQTPKEQPLKLRQHNNLAFVENLMVHKVESYAELRNWLDLGNSRRKTASTGMNDKSSRSHSIFNVMLKMTDETNRFGQSVSAQTKLSKISLVDLAGSERVSQTCASGDRLKEGVSINKNLLTLGMVIKGLTDPKKFVPYRDSVLTKLLKDNLGGNSKTVLLATISPASQHLDETLATLRYACQARSIVNRTKVNEDPKDRQIRELLVEVERLTALEQANKWHETHAAQTQTQPRKFIIETIDVSDESEKESLRQRLQEMEKELIKAQNNWRDQLRETENLRKKELQLLKHDGLAVELTVTKKQPCLINISPDAMISGAMLYILPPGTIQIGRSKSAEISLDSSAIGINHCQIENKRGKLFIRSESQTKETFVNGELLGGERQIYHGDRIALGNSYFFRVSNPDCPKLASKSLIDFESAQKEILKEQEKLLRQQLMVEKASELRQIEDERTQQELSFKEKMAKLKIEREMLNAEREILDMEKKCMTKEQLEESIRDGKSLDYMLEQLQTITHPTDSDLQDIQSKIDEANRMCRKHSVAYEFTKRLITDEFGILEVEIILNDRENDRMAKWMISRLKIWLDMIRGKRCGEITNDNVFSLFDVEWTAAKACNELNNSLSSMRSCFENIRHKILSPRSDKENRPSNELEKSPANKNRKRQSHNDNDGELNVSSLLLSCNLDEQLFEAQAQTYLKELRKATLRLKKLCHQNVNDETANRMEVNKVLNAVEDVEGMTNEIRKMLRDTAIDEQQQQLGKKSVRFNLD